MARYANPEMRVMESVRKRVSAQGAFRSVGAEVAREPNDGASYETSDTQCSVCDAPLMLDPE